MNAITEEIHHVKMNIVKVHEVVEIHTVNLHIIQIDQDMNHIEIIMEIQEIINQMIIHMVMNVKVTATEEIIIMIIEIITSIQIMIIINNNHVHITQIMNKNWTII